SELRRHRVVVEVDVQDIREVPWLKEEPLEFIPPELTLRIDVVGRDEDGGWNAMGLEQRLRIEEVVCVAVIEGDRHVTIQVSLSRGLDRRGETGGPEARTQNCEVLIELIGADAHPLWVTRKILYAVV